MLGKPAGFGKRTGAVIIDFICIYLLFIILNLGVMQLFYDSSGLHEATAMCQSYTEEIINSRVKYELGTIDENGNYVQDERFTNTNLSNYIDLETSEEYKKFKADPHVIWVEKQLKDSTFRANLLATILYAPSILIAEAVVFLVIPLFFKHHQTFGKKLFKLGVVNKHDYKASKLSNFIRFAAIFLLETAAVWLIIVFVPGLQMLAIGIPFISFTIVCFSKNRSSLHDLISNTKVVELQDSTIFNTLEERNQYITELNAKMNENQEPSKNLDFLELESEKNHKNNR